MLDKIKEHPLQYDGIILIWDNHRAHTTPAIERKAHLLGISIVNLPTYSPKRYAAPAEPHRKALEVYQSSFGRSWIH